MGRRACSTVCMVSWQAQRRRAGQASTGASSRRTVCLPGPMLAPAQHSASHAAACTSYVAWLATEGKGLPSWSGAPLIMMPACHVLRPLAPLPPAQSLHLLCCCLPCPAVRQANPRRVAKVAKQIEREVGNLLITDKVGAGQRLWVLGSAGGCGGGAERWRDVGAGLDAVALLKSSGGCWAAAVGADKFWAAGGGCWAAVVGAKQRRSF